MHTTGGSLCVAMLKLLVHLNLVMSLLVLELTLSLRCVFPLNFITTCTNPREHLWRIPAFRRIGHFGLAVHFVASPELHGQFMCCPDSHSTSAILCTCLAMFCTSATLDATAFPSPSPPCHFLCTSHISSLAFLSHPPLPPPIPKCFSDCVVPIWHICCLDRGFECLPLLRLPFWRY
jgi:hypothetical protein